MRLLLALAIAPLVACSSDTDPPNKPGTPGPGPQEGCQALLNELGKDHVLAGAQMTDLTARAAPFDVRYLYIAGGTFDSGSSCSSCASDCRAGGRACDNNSGGCAWWGCWQWDQVPPGAYVRDFVTTCEAEDQIPMITYYQQLNISGVPEGSPQVHALDNDTTMLRYYADFRVLLLALGDARAMLHIEPDFWGYAQIVGDDPHAVPAAVARVNPDCADHANTVAGFGRCLITMTRKHAPNTLVGLHASPWGTLIDVFMNEEPTYNIAAEAGMLGDFLVEVGAGAGDFIVADMTDRDAGYDAVWNGQDTFWDDTNATLPNFHQAFAWGKVVAETVGLPLVWWQIPLGNMDLPNTANRWHDNRIDYMFSHVDEIEAGHGVAMLFGSGNDEQTTPETDGGNLVANMNAYATSGQTYSCE
jgi:hypothetical protein